ncbi:MAG: peptidase C15 [Candidatus Thermoplasmatota archaeon]|nr:peptidase C15 [Candidatus Thermoplasmatota archaeon]
MKQKPFLSALIVVALLSIQFSTYYVDASNNQFHYQEENNQNKIILLTGFGPFSKYSVNPSQLIVENLNGTTIDNATVVGRILSVDFELSKKEICQAIDDIKPSLVLSLGLSPVTRWIDVELIGWNLRGIPKKENPLVPYARLNKSGPFFRLTSLNTFKITNAIWKAGVPAYLSVSAGTYICNSVLYNTLSYIKENNLSIEAGFIHVPLLLSQDPKGMELETMISAVTTALIVSI